MEKRKIDNLGRVAIPIEVRKRLGLVDEGYINVSYTDDSIILTRAIDYCILCQSETELVELNRYTYICKDCLSKKIRKKKSKITKNTPLYWCVLSFVAVIIGFGVFNRGGGPNGAAASAAPGLGAGAGGRTGKNFLLGALCDSHWHVVYGICAATALVAQWRIEIVHTVTFHN